MPELIDRHSLLKKVYEHPQDRERMTDGEWCRKCIYEAPKVEAEPVRHGRWIVHTTWNGMFGLIHSECSECKFDRNGDLSSWKFCQNCGRDMRATDTNVGGKGGADNDS
jgi:hypothetical protein